MDLKTRATRLSGRVSWRHAIRNGSNRVVEVSNALTNVSPHIFRVRPGVRMRENA